MSPEQINMQAVKNLPQTMGIVFLLVLVCFGIWYGTVAVCWLIEKAKEIFMKIERGRFNRPPHCK